MAYNCEKCFFTTHIKTHYNRHLETEKHKLKCSPLAQQLIDLKMKEMEFKTEAKMKEMAAKLEMKREELEKKDEIKRKEIELKQQIKDELLQTEDKVISRLSLEKSIPLIKLMERVIDRSTIEDYNDIFNGATTFEDVFLRDFREEYAENKSIVLDKGGKTGYYMNNAPCLWFFYTDDPLGNPVRRLFSLIPLYHKYLKEFAKENGCNIERFVLTADVQKRIEDHLLEDITYMVSNV
jgi:hypothetical protein